MEGNGLCFDFTFLHVHLVTSEDNWDLLADTDKIACEIHQPKRISRCGGRHTVPVGNVLVGDARSNIEHDDTALTVDVVPVPQATKLFLPGGIPDVKLDGSIVLEAT